MQRSSQIFMALKYILQVLNGFLIILLLYPLENYNSRDMAYSVEFLMLSLDFTKYFMSNEGGVES